LEENELSLLKKIKILTGKKLNSTFVGEYHTAFKGMGLEFESVREYQFGDDVKSIDWNVSARMNHLYIKEYIEERELSIVLMLDISGSLDFGNTKSKSNIMMEVATLFLYLAQMNNDSISVLMFSDKVEKFIKPKKGRKFILKILDEIIKYKPESKKTDISNALDFVSKVQKKRSVIFLLSDFLDEKREDFILKMKLLLKKHDIVPIQIFDPLEKKLNFFGLTEFIDLETGESFLTDSIPENSNFNLLNEFNSIQLNTEEPIEIPILKFFEKRNKSKLTRKG
jgi:uncharacterized protein (DUF58 family)